MAHKDRKVHKIRGSRSCGYGNTQKHRGAGSRGGRGMAGSKKHKWTFVSKYMPDHFGRKGFTRHKSLIKNPSTLNVGDLDRYVDVWVSEGKAEKTKDKFKVDLNSIGYEKLLGTGKVTRKYTLKVDSCSQKAREKIEASGGKIEVPEQPQEEAKKEAEGGGAGEPVKEVSDEPGVHKAGTKISP